MTMSDGVSDFPKYSFKLSATGCFTELSPSCLGLLAYQADELLNHFWLESLSLTERGFRQTKWQEWLDSDQVDLELDLHVRKACGESIPLHVTLLRQSDSYKGYFTPVPVNIEYSQHLQALEARVDVLFRSTDQHIVILDTQHRILDFNQAAAHIARHRFHREMHYGEDFTNYVQPDRMDDFYESFEQALKGQNVFKERVIYAPDGEGHSYEMSYTPIYDSHGQISTVCYRSINIEQQAQTKLLLHHEKSFVSSILNTTNALILVADKQGKILRFNQACEALTLYTADQVIGKVLWDFLVLPEDHQRIKELYQQLDSSLTQHNIQFRVLDRYGDSHLISWSLSMIPGLLEENSLIVSTGIDVTALLAAEQALQESEAMLRQAQKMDAVGRLASGIAHDFNNLLTAIMGYGELLQSTVQMEPVGHEYLNDILKTCHKARELTQQLLMFSRKAPIESHPLEIHQLLYHMRNLVQQLVGSDIHFLLDIPSTPVWVNGNTLHLEQVIMNLVINARDAMNGKGRLSLSSHTKTLKKHKNHALFGRIPPGDYISIQISDTGSGIDKAILHTIFDPFFTTKDRGKGTGLGLAIVYRIIKECKGWVDVLSNPDKGTVFELCLPTLPEPDCIHLDRNYCLGIYRLSWPQEQDIRKALSQLPYEFMSSGGYNKPQQMFLQLVKPDLLVTDLEACTDPDLKALLDEQPSFKILYLASEECAQLDLLDDLGPREDVLMRPFSPVQLQIRIQRMRNS